MTCIPSSEGLSISVVTVQTHDSIEQIVIISKKGLLKIRQNDGVSECEKILKLISATELLNCGKVDRYFQEGRIAFIDANDKLHVRKDVYGEIHGKVKELAYDTNSVKEGTAVISELEEMDDEEFALLQANILQIFDALNKAKNSGTSTTKSEASANTAKIEFHAIDPQVLQLQFELNLSQIITRLLESFAKAERDEKARREEQYKERIEKEKDLKVRLLSWALKQWNIKVEDVVARALQSAVLSQYVRQEKRDWHALHPNNQYGYTKIAAH